MTDFDDHIISLILIPEMSVWRTQFKTKMNDRHWDSFNKMKNHRVRKVDVLRPFFTWIEYDNTSNLFNLVYFIYYVRVILNENNNNSVSKRYVVV